ncbi:MULTISPECIES: hypothetical protein [Nocardiaceae]|nr:MULTISPECIES: hypothetical protein [Rhodococcus]
MIFLAILTVAVMAVSGAVASRAPRSLVQTPDQRRGTPAETPAGVW